MKKLVPLLIFLMVAGGLVALFLAQRPSHPERLVGQWIHVHEFDFGSTSYVAISLYPDGRCEVKRWMEGYSKPNPTCEEMVWESRWGDLYTRRTGDEEWVKDDVLLLTDDEMHLRDTTSAEGHSDWGKWPLDYNPVGS